MCLPHIYFSENTGLYFYSALLQANAAILSIVGVFFIFRIQQLKSEIDSIKDYVSFRFQNDARKYYHEFNLANLEEKNEIIERYKKKNYIESDPYHKLPDWYTRELELKKIIGSIKAPTIILAFSILMNTVFLLFAENFHKSSYSIEFSAFLFTLLLEIFVLIFVVKGIFDSLSNKFIDKAKKAE